MKINKSKLKLISVFLLSPFIFINCDVNKQDQSDHNLLIGWAMEDITPKGQPSLYGQYYERISEYVQSPLKATAFAIESIKDKEQAIMVSLDLTKIDKDLEDSIREIIRSRLKDFNDKKLLLNATHTHTAIDHRDSIYRKLLIKKIASVAIHAWNNRKPAGISNKLGYAVIGHNRRVMYADGSTEMYGSIDRKDFIGIEGPTDPGVDMLFCWDRKNNLTGIIMNVSCPAQVVEAKYFISSDYWSEVRKQLNEKFGNEIFVLPQCGAAGDISPRDLPRRYRAGEPNMWDIPGILEIGERLIHVVQKAYPDAKENIRYNVLFKHIIKDVALPARMISSKEYVKAKAIVEKINSREPKDPNSSESAWNRFVREIKENEKTKLYGPWDNKTSDFGWLKPCKAIIERYENQKSDQQINVEIHALRLGDLVFATNPFELYVDYGFQIIGRSKANQTFIVQLCCDGLTYLPTQRAVEGGGYSAMITPVGPEGGQMLVEETVDVIDSLWVTK